jgi:hypothetical protein
MAMILPILPGRGTVEVFGFDALVTLLDGRWWATVDGVVDASWSFALTFRVFVLVMTSPWVAAAKSLPPPQAPDGASPWGWRLSG